MGAGWVEVLAGKLEGDGEGPLVFLPCGGPRAWGVWLSSHRAAADSLLRFTQYWSRLYSRVPQSSQGQLYDLITSLTQGKYREI